MSKTRVIRTGHIIDVYEYEKLNTNPRIKDDIHLIEKGTGIFTAQNYLQTMKKRKASIIQKANMNFDNNSVFITLTHAENITDIKLSNKLFKQFVQRLKRAYPDIDLKYLAVIEFQKRGAIHYHMLLNIDYIENAKLNKLWSNGFVKINAITSVDNVGAYISKYLSKTTDDERLKGFKSYNYSKNLLEPIVYKSWKGQNIEILQIKEELENLKKMPDYSVKYSSYHNGDMSYSQYNLNRKPK